MRRLTYCQKLEHKIIIQTSPLNFRLVKNVNSKKMIARMVRKNNLDLNIVLKSNTIGQIRILKNPIFLMFGI